MSAVGLLRVVGRRRALAGMTALVLVIAGCTEEHHTQPAPDRCASFAFDREHPYYAAIDASYTDADLLTWRTAAPDAVGLDGARLDTAAEELERSHDIASLLVARDGKLVVERYFNGHTASQANNVHSLSKSILSVVTGIAIAEGDLSLDTQVGAVLPADLVGEHGDLTVRSLLTMSGGLELRADEGDYESAPSTPATTPFVQAVLARPSVAPAGTVFAYSTGLTQVLAAVVTEAVGESLCAFASERLLGPLGIEADRWWVETGGYFSGGHSLFLTPREIARFGQLVLQHGRWEGEQLVPAGWLDETLAERWDLRCLRNPPVRAGYGYLWWRYDIGGHVVWLASGFGAQDLAIVDDLGLVVVVTHDTTSRSRQERVGLPRLLHHLLLEAVDGEPTPGPSPSCEPQLFAASSVRPDGSGRTPVVDWPSDAVPWSWSPDGSRMAVQVDTLDPEIFTIGPDGTDRHRLTTDFAPDLMPAWSPHGSAIAFSRGTPTDADLYRADADGLNLVRLTDYDGYEQSPTWSPDGTRLAFVWGHRETRGFGEAGELWAVAPDGSDSERLFAGDVGLPAWSPDGERIALELRGATTHVGVLRLDDGSLADLGEGHAPKWSPDGSRLVFVSLREDSGSDLFTVNADGSGRVRLTDDTAFDTLPLWSPDGATIRFLTRDR